MRIRFIFCNMWVIRIAKRIKLVILVGCCRNTLYKNIIMLKNIKKFYKSVDDIDKKGFVFKVSDDIVYARGLLRVQMSEMVKFEKENETIYGIVNYLVNVVAKKILALVDTTNISINRIIASMNKQLIMQTNSKIFKRVLNKKNKIRKKISIKRFYTKSNVTFMILGKIYSRMGNNFFRKKRNYSSLTGPKKEFAYHPVIYDVYKVTTIDGEIKFVLVNGNITHGYYVDGEIAEDIGIGEDGQVIRVPLNMMTFEEITVENKVYILSKLENTRDYDPKAQNEDIYEKMGEKTKKGLQVSGNYNEVVSLTDGKCLNKHIIGVVVDLFKKTD